MKKSAIIAALLMAFCTLCAYAAPKKEILKDSRDGKTYKTVKIGTQVWMAENLNYETKESFCLDNDSNNCSKNGRLYSWIDAKKVCPTDWHLPAKFEMESLLKIVGGVYKEEKNRDIYLHAGEKLKATAGWSENEKLSDSYGFSALSAGRWNPAFMDFDLKDDVFFWTSTEGKSIVKEHAFHIYTAFVLHLFNKDSGAYLEEYTLDAAYSVRCVKNN